MDRGAMFLSFFARLARLRTGPAPAVEGLLFIAGLWPSERHPEPLVKGARTVTTEQQQCFSGIGSGSWRLAFFLTIFFDY